MTHSSFIDKLPFLFTSFDKRFHFCCSTFLGLEGSIKQGMVSLGQDSKLRVWGLTSAEVQKCAGRSQSALVAGGSPALQEGGATRRRTNVVYNIQNLRQEIVRVSSKLPAFDLASFDPHTRFVADPPKQYLPKKRTQTHLHSVCLSCNLLVSFFFLSCLFLLCL